MTRFSFILHIFYEQAKHNAHNFFRIHADFIKYYSAFENLFMNLLRVYQVECHTRISRVVLTEDRDSLMEEKIYSSAAIVLNCIHTVLEEYNKLELEDEDVQFAFLIQVTDIICDGCKIYSESLFGREVDVKDQDFMQKLCTLGNSVRHIRIFMSQLPEMMRWHESLDVSHCNSASSIFRLQVKRVLNLIVQSMETDLLQTQQCIYRRAVVRIGNLCQKHLKSWVHNHIIKPTGHQSIERLVATQHHHLQIINDSIPNEDFSWFLGQLWLFHLRYIKDNFHEGKSPEYGKTVKKNLEELHQYFSDLNVHLFDEGSVLYSQIYQSVSLNAMSTVELELCYFEYLANIVHSPIDYFGHLAFQCGYRQTSQGTVTIQIKVQKGQRIPLRKFNIEMLNAKVELQPHQMFPSFRPVQTRTITEQLDKPVFNESFMFKNLPSSVLSVAGAVLEIWLTNQDSTYNASAILKLNRVANMKGLSSIDFLPVHVMALRPLELNHPSFTIMGLRKMDRHAKRLVRSRLEAGKNKTTLLTCFGRRGTTKTSKKDT